MHFKLVRCCKIKGNSKNKNDIYIYIQRRFPFPPNLASTTAKIEAISVNVQNDHNVKLPPSRAIYLWNEGLAFRPPPPRGGSRGGKEQPTPKDNARRVPRSMLLGDRVQIQVPSTSPRYFAGIWGGGALSSLAGHEPVSSSIRRNNFLDYSTRCTSFLVQFLSVTDYIKFILFL